MIRVCTLMWGTAWERYGETFARSFAQFWPDSVELTVFTDRSLPIPGAVQIDLASIQAIEAFRLRHHRDPKANGFESSAKTDANGYSFRHDAVKWMPQAAVPAVAMRGLSTGDILVWLDADVATTSPVPAGWIESLLGDADVACLQRTGTHSEIGFYALRVGPKTRRLCERFADLFIGDGIFTFNEWHSAFAFDRAMEFVPGLVVENLSPGLRGHVWPQTRLAEHTVHFKGKRKDRK